MVGSLVQRGTSTTTSSGWKREEDGEAVIVLDPHEVQILLEIVEASVANVRSVEKTKATNGKGSAVSPTE